MPQQTAEIPVKHYPEGRVLGLRAAFLDILEDSRQSIRSEADPITRDKLQTRHHAFLDALQLLDVLISNGSVRAATARLLDPSIRG